MSETSLVAKFVMDVAALAPEGEAVPDGADPHTRAVTDLATRTREFLKLAATWETAMNETNRLQSSGAAKEPVQFAMTTEQRAFTQTMNAHRMLDADMTHTATKFGDGVLDTDHRWNLLQMVVACFSQALTEQRSRYFVKGPLGVIE